MKQPKYEVGQKVKLKKKTLYGETEGEIVRVEKIFQEIDESGNFNPDGLSTLESTIDSISIPYTFDGETLTVEFPAIECTNIIIKAKKRVSKFSGYAYTVETPKMNTMFSESTLIKI